MWAEPGVAGGRTRNRECFRTGGSELRCYIIAKRKDISRRIERKIITEGIKVGHCFRIRKFVPVTCRYAVRAQGGSALGQSNIKGY